MNRNEFIKKLFLMYRGQFTEENVASWHEVYCVVLKSNWDYDKLLRLMARHYDKTNVAPAPSYFVQFKSMVEPKEEIKMLPRESKEDYCPPTDAFKKARERLKQKLSAREIK